jgi:predicted SAM-dependent methyltransferase
MLEIGAGDHTVADFLTRKGIIVKTFDNDANLRPDYVGDMRNRLTIGEKFDLILASEVLEHVNIRWLDTICNNLKKALLPNGYLVVSLPYSTVRLFPKRYSYGRILSCEGRLQTHIPYFSVQPILRLFRGLYKTIFRRSNYREAFRPFEIPPYPDDKFDVHHWDLGYRATSRKLVRRIFAKHFVVVEEICYFDTNCVFFILKVPDRK